jgi:hypothetical protein
MPSKKRGIREFDEPTDRNLTDRNLDSDQRARKRLVVIPSHRNLLLLGDSCCLKCLFEILRMLRGNNTTPEVV